MSEETTKEEFVVEFIKAFKAIEDEMEPYKEHKRDLRKNYVQNGWSFKYSSNGELIDSVNVGIIPGGYCFN